ncbi:MAG: alpha-2-macroglobulin, partial [Flavobacteriaceae bacterium]|nr:alpha-2-macroglobulin [Flavobacteriaceae bacterium]
NLQETAFFYPRLTTDKEGNVSFNFTVPESLTRWKLQLLAHTKTLEAATKELSAVTQKDLMVLPNLPRFFRQGDTIVFASKVANLSDKDLNGIAQLQLFDALTDKDITQRLLIAEEQRGQKDFTIKAKSNTNVSWTLIIPDEIQAIKYRIVAKAGTFSDGEENALPVLSNRMLVTETLPMWVRSGQTKTFVLDKLKDNTSATLKNYNLSLEVTSNPAWYAVQALPYLMEYPYECAEQTFSRYYANALGSHIANSNPRIQEVFNQWKNSDALLSNLEKNEELKSLIIQETPWLREAQSETEQKKRIALLFDLNKMNNDLQAALRKLEQMQMSNGGFPWFKGSRYPSRYITQHIAAGYGHLKKLNVILNSSEESQVKNMIQKAVGFLDNEILNDYWELEKQAKRIRESARTKTEGAKKEAAFWAQNHTGNLQIQYLYMRSFYPAIPIDSKVKKAVDYYLGQTFKFWKDNDLYTTGMVALIAYRNKDKVLAEKILSSLKENAVNSDELGMYWKANTAGWYWYQAPIETQALMIEVFSEISGDSKDIDELKVWLLKNKQTNSWKTTKATTEAVYALLLQGTDWLETSDLVTVDIGNETIDPLQLEDTKVEAGTGYFKTSWKGGDIKPDMASVTLSKKSEGIAWGALYWQYFEDLDKITFSETPLQLKKKLYLKKNTDKGEELAEITSKTALHLGDLVRVRIELRADRDMEFIHMKDMRAAGFEPVNVLSQYKWQDGLGYYESTKDAATNFFFDYLPKGVYVFEYDLRVNNMGDFSNGITTVQSMYAPEFSSHSEGVRVKVE